MKEESKKAVLKLNMKKTKIMVSDPITSWEIDGETVETVTKFIFLGSKITADGDVIDISLGNLDSSLYFIQPSISHDVLCI